MTTYPTIPLVQFWGNSASYDARFGKVQIGDGGVVGRTRSHALNSNRGSYSVSGNVRDRETLHNFLDERLGKPFVWYPDNSNPAGLFICTDWDFKWTVYAEGSGVWNFSGNFRQVYRPDWKPVAAPFEMPSVGIKAGAGLTLGEPDFSYRLSAGVEAGAALTLAAPVFIYLLSAGAETGAALALGSTSAWSDLTEADWSGLTETDWNGIGATNPFARTTESGNVRITEAGNIRITEAG